jgi:uncharacterized protein
MNALPLPQRRLFYWLCATLFLFWASLAQAQQLVAIPPLTGPVIDQTGTLTPDEIAGLEARLKSYAATKGAQVQVVIVPTTQPEEIEQFGIRLVDSYKLGRAKVDDAVILIVAKNDRNARIEVQYGLDGAIPDIVARRIIDQIIFPQFRAGNFYGGIHDGVEGIIKRIDGEELPQPPRNSSSVTPDFGTFITFILIFSFVVGPVLRAIFGKYLGPVAAGLGGGGIGFLIMASLGFGVAGGFIAFLLTMLFGNSGGGGRWHTGSSGGTWGGGGWSGGGWSGGSSGGGWSGGGGSGGGGGASGSW